MVENILKELSDKNFNWLKRKENQSQFLLKKVLEHSYSNFDNLEKILEGDDIRLSCYRILVFEQNKSFEKFLRKRN